MTKIKLSDKQKEVIKSLQNGYVIITDSTERGAWIGNNKGQFHISARVFWNLVDKGLIYQSLHHKDRFNYTLTNLGKTIEL